MAQAQVEAEFEELYRKRRVRVMWRLSKQWTLMTASVHAEWVQVLLFLRTDDIDAPPHIRKLTFQSEQECGDYLLAKRLELESEGWSEEEAS